MTRLEKLIEFRERVKAGKDWHFDEFDPSGLLPELWVSAFHGSLDAAKALHDAVLPNCAFDVSHWPNGTSGVLISGTHEGQDGQRWHGGDDIKANGTDKDPARAWLIAIIQALIAQEGVDQQAGK